MFHQRQLLCRDVWSVPLWVAPLLNAAARLKSGRARRKKAYRLIQRKLFHHKIGCSQEDMYPTYVYPAELKELIRTVFPGGICDYLDPCHEKVVVVTMEDINGLIPSVPSGP